MRKWTVNVGDQRLANDLYELVDTPEGDTAASLDGTTVQFNQTGFDILADIMPGDDFSLAAYGDLDAPGFVASLWVGEDSFTVKRAG